MSGFYDKVPAMIRQITEEIGWLREGVLADETLSAEEMRTELGGLEMGAIAELKDVLRHLWLYRRRMSPLTPAQQLNNLFTGLAEACLDDKEMADEVLREAGYDPEEIARKGLAFVKHIQEQAKNRI